MSTTGSGRPVRFFVILMGGWAMVRIASGMLASVGPAALPSSRPKPLAAGQNASDRWAAGHFTRASARAWPMLTAMSPRTEEPSSAPPLLAHATMIPIREQAARSAVTIPMPVRIAVVAAPAPVAVGTAETAVPATSQDAPVAIPLAAPTNPRSDRWRASVWLLWREGSATPANAVTAGRLGGSQAGLRIDYDVTPHAPGRTAPYGRVTAALNRPASPEAAFGLAWQPDRAVPISLSAERRIALGKGARDANALMLVGGFGPTPLLAGLEAETYAQAGMVGFHSRDLFVDGKFSLLAPVAHSPLRIGASVSGGAQPQVERLDVGPEIQLRLPLPRINTRLSIEWRERIAGHAAPSSGLAVTLGADF